MAASRRWRITIPFVLALAVVLFWGVSAAWNVRYPHDGIVTFSRTGEIIELDSFGRDINHFQENDVIVSVDGVPFSEAVPFYRNKQAGDTVLFRLKRGDESLDRKFVLQKPPISLLIDVLVPTLVSLIFWGIGLRILTFRPGDVTSDLFFYFCMGAALSLVAGLSSSVGPEWTSRLFNFLLWLIGPLTVHFHLHFPQTTLLRGRRFLLLALYALVLLGGLPYLIFGTNAVRSSAWATPIVISGPFFLAANLMLALGLLIYNYRGTSSPGVRGKIRIVVLGGAISFIPLIALTILPAALLGQPILSYAFAFLFLGILPLTYGYAIIRHQLIKFEQNVNRGATYFLVFSLLVSLYLVLYAILHAALPEELFSQTILINTLLAVSLAAAYGPIHRWMQQVVDKAFYGGWYDYRSAVTGITQGLEQVTDLSNLASTVSERLVKTLQLESVCAFLRDLEGEFSVIQIAPQGKIPSLDGSCFSTLPKNSLAYLLNVGAVERTSLRRSLSEVTLSPEERQLLDSEQANLWLPVIGHGQVLGLLALGPKLGGDVFSGEDMDILRIVARQLGPLIENIHLVTQLRRYAAELEQRVKDRTAELHAAKERVEAVLSSVGDGVIVTDLNGRIITVNQAFEEQSGFSAEEVLGGEIYHLLNGQETEDRTAEIRTALSSKGAWDGALRALHKAGRRYDVQLTIASIRDQSGDIIGYVGSQRDITQAKQLERLKDQFILEVSHELRTPVTNMGLFVDLLERGRQEKRAFYLATLKNEINQLANMIEDVLDLSRLEIGKQKKATFTSVDLNLLAEQVISAHVPVAQEGGLELEFKPGNNLPPVRGEPNQLSRVITNLLSNAIRYTPAGCVLVRTFATEDGVCLEVKDTGIGIDPEDYPHLFERFFRGKKVSQSRIMGSGLGLALVKEIVDIHEGRIEWQSEDSHGSTFQVWLPRV